MVPRRFGRAAGEVPSKTSITVGQYEVIGEQACATRVSGVPSPLTSAVTTFWISTFCGDWQGSMTCFQSVCRVWVAGAVVAVAAGPAVPAVVAVVVVVAGAGVVVVRCSLVVHPAVSAIRATLDRPARFNTWIP